GLASGFGLDSASLGRVQNAGRWVYRLGAEASAVPHQLVMTCISNARLFLSLRPIPLDGIGPSEPVFVGEVIIEMMKSVLQQCPEGIEIRCLTIADQAPRTRHSHDEGPHVHRPILRPEPCWVERWTTAGHKYFARCRQFAAVCVHSARRNSRWIGLR